MLKSLELTIKRRMRAAQAKLARTVRSTMRPVAR